jgi:hypothetical protein
MQGTAAAYAKFRGVLCRYCGKASPLPASIVARENIIKQREPNPIQQWGSRVFPLRCKRCGGEAVYMLSQVSDFPESVPREVRK